jgi:tRNA dimethylallyltransferase
LEHPLTAGAAREPILPVVLGPTASGKTALAITLAEKMDAEIVNCDSVAMYREFEIGTAKPSPQERERVPHHLLDCVDPAGVMTAGAYGREARKVLAEIRNRGKTAIVAGGTGLYLRALLDGLFAAPPRSDQLRERLRSRADEKGPAYLHRILRRMDPEAAQGIHPNDAAKLVRAIEVCLTSRGRMTEMWKRGRDPLRGFRILRLGLNPERQKLYERINLRARKMFDAGLAEETSALLEKYGDQAWALKSLGYKQAVALIRKQMTLEQAIEAAQQAHRNYAKRQMTWFRREPDVLWLQGFGDDPGIQQQALETLQAAAPR